MDPTVFAALIGVGGAALGFVGRDVVMTLYLARRQKEEEYKSRAERSARERLDVVRRYADPLYEAARSLRFRLDEIIASGHGEYLQAMTASTPFFEYKRISTLYRLAALLGWIRAFRRERSYLDPHDASATAATSDPIAAIEGALADGQHVDDQRLDELLALWKVGREAVADPLMRARLALRIDAIREDLLASEGRLSVADLSDDQKQDLVFRCAAAIGEQAGIGIPREAVDASKEQASLLLGIKEAYIYRDWQAAIGDAMLAESATGPRRFEVIGFGAFESRYVAAREPDGDPAERRWLDRIEMLFHDLDMSQTGIFDARRQQIRNLNESCRLLEEHLKSRIVELQNYSQ